jgi:aspartyl-tRNA(Asn)/glutamyl-tRNA(Gln) amidotransferase subunit A
MKKPKDDIDKEIMIDLKTLTIEKAHEMLTKGEIKVLELANLYLENIKEKNKDLNVYLEVFDDIEEQAREAQKKIDDGEATILTGIPIAVKDNILIKRKTCSSASKILENYKAPYSSTVIKKLQKHRPVFLGRLNMDEFAQGTTTENSAFSVVKNPNDETRVAGGTSGGSAAAVAANMSLVSLGSDTGGSIRLPASYCGVVGLKPTYGAVSRYGLMAMASSFDVIGPLAKNISDVEILFNAIKGKDDLDSTSISIPSTRVSGGEKSPESDGKEEFKTIGVPRDFLKEGIDEDVLENFEESIKKLEKEGKYKIKDISIPMIDKALAVYYILVPAEVSSNMARYDGIKYGEKLGGKDLLETYFKTRGKFLGPEVKRRIMLGTYVLSSGYADQYYRKAWQVRNKIKESFSDVFKKVDLIAMPVGTSPAIKIGEKSNDPLSLYLLDIFTVVANVTGIPAISIPSGEVDREGKKLPVGFQLLAPHLCEKNLFEAGKNFEKINDSF